MFYFNLVGSNILRVDQAPEKVILAITSFFALERLSFQISEVPEREKTLEFAFEGTPWSSRNKDAVFKTNSIICGLIAALERKKYFVYTSINTGFGRVFDHLQVRHRHISQDMHPVVSDTLIFSNHHRVASKKFELVTFRRNKLISFFKLDPKTLDLEDEGIKANSENEIRDIVLQATPWTMSIDAVNPEVEVEILTVLCKMYAKGWRLLATFIPSIYHVFYKLIQFNTDCTIWGKSDTHEANLTMLVLIGSNCLLVVSPQPDLKDVLVGLGFNLVAEETTHMEFKYKAKIFNGDHESMKIFLEMIEQCANSGWAIEGTFGTRQGPPIEHKRYLILKKQ